MTSTLLAPLAALYGGAIRARASLYKRGWLRSERAGVPVLSVGNIVAGGTGKTPVTALVAGLLRDAGLHPAIISRGYRGRRDDDPLVVSDATAMNAKATAARAGDEPMMLARLLPGVPVVVARRRAEGARLAVSRLGARVLVLDDGFQHLALRRDLDLVLLDGENHFDNGRLLPAGLLREPPGALGRATAIAVTGLLNDQESAAMHSAVGLGPISAPLEEVVARWAKPGTPLFHISIEPTLVVSGRDPDPRSSNRIAELTDSSWFEGMHVVAFAGIARPHRLTKDLRRLGAEVVSFEPFPDHHVYTGDEIQRLLGKVREFTPDALVTTEKDLERLRGTPFHKQLIDRGLLALRVEATLAAREMHAFREMILSAAHGDLDRPERDGVEGAG